MIIGNSRYGDASQMYAGGHSYDKYRRVLIKGDDPTSTDPLMRNNTIVYRLSQAKSAPRGNIQYPVKQDENLQMISYKVLKNHDQWWRIAEHNTQLWYPLDTYPGLILDIPI